MSNDSFEYKNQQMDEISKKAEKFLSNSEIETTTPFLNSHHASQDKTSDLSLEEELVHKDLISNDQLQVALKMQRSDEEKKDIGKILVELGFITETALAEVFSENSGIKSFDLRSVALDVNLIRKVPKSIAIQYKIIPIQLEGDVLIVATPDVFNIVAFDNVKRYFEKTIKIVPQFANEMQITDIIDQYYEYEMQIDGILREIESSSTDENFYNNNIKNNGYVNPTVRLIDAILIDAIRKEASDLHFEPENSFVRLRYRIDGRLMQILTFHKDYWSAILVRIKILSGMNIAETRNPQDGRISYVVMGRTVDFRISTQPTVHGENVVARILDKNKALVSIDALGLSSDNLSKLKKLLKRPEGVVIVTGPTGCGKTTTLYSILSYINSMNINIMTLEDPIEYQIPLIRQSAAKEGTGMNFSEGIRSMMRQDPDVIFIGEVRDPDTANMTIRAAMTGHQVYTTLHTSDAIGSIPRLVDLGIKPSLLEGTIICIIAQRLTRKLCKHCKTEYSPSKEECAVLGAEHDSNLKLFKHNGCEKCYHTGYKGRVAISEILAIDRQLDELISLESSRKEMLEYAKKAGFKTMAEDGITKVLSGITDIDELIRTVDMTSRI